MTNEYLRARSALQHLDAGMDRDTWVRVAMSAKAAGLTLEDFTQWSRQGSNYTNDKDCAAVWRSVSAGPITAATLFHLAIADGWKDETRQSWTTARPAARLLKGDRGGRPPSHAPDQRVTSLWESMAPAPAFHPYIEAKRGHPDGLRVVPTGYPKRIAGLPLDGWLVVPVRSLSGALRTLQFIPPPGTGKKLNLPGTGFEDGLFVVGTLSENVCVYVTEGIGQAWACAAATGSPAVVAFGSGRLPTVTKLLRESFPTSRLVLVPDRGKEVQAEEVARETRAEWVEFPTSCPANFDANDYARLHGNEALADLLLDTRTPSMRYRLLGVSDLMSQPPLTWLVRGVLPAQGLAALYGASGTGKSFLALDLCAAIAEGVEWFGHRVTPAPIVYVALEGEAGFKQRALAWQTHSGRPFPQSVRFIMQSFDLRQSDDVTDLVSAVAASGMADSMVVIDTLNRAAPGMDENSSQDMGRLIEAAKALQSRLGGLVLLVHHAGKDQTRGLRGHSSLHAALDAAIEVTRREDQREWRNAKSKDGRDGDTYPFRLITVDVGADSYGEPVTSCVVERDQSHAVMRRTIPPKSGNQRVAWEAVRELVPAAGDLDTEKPHDIPIETAVARIRERLTCDPKRRTERAMQALMGLRGRGLVVVDRGSLRLS